MENNKQSEDQRKNDFVIGDIERIRLTSKTYIERTPINPKFWNKTLITTLILIIIFLSVFIFGNGIHFLILIPFSINGIFIF